MKDLLLILLAGSVWVCAYVALGLVLDARNKLRKAEELWHRRALELKRRIDALEKEAPAPEAKRSRLAEAASLKPPPTPKAPRPVRAPESEPV